MKYLRKVKKYVDKKTSPENYENACGEDEEDAEAEDMVLFFCFSTLSRKLTNNLSFDTLT